MTPLSFPFPALSPVIKSRFEDSSHHLYKSTNPTVKVLPHVYPHDVRVRSNSQRKRSTGCSRISLLKPRHRWGQNLFCSMMPSKWSMCWTSSGWLSSPSPEPRHSRALGRAGSWPDASDSHESGENYGASFSNIWHLFWLSLEIGRYDLEHKLAK